MNFLKNKLIFIVYLNDDYLGGEIEFLNGLKINKKIGKLLIFPNSWTFLYKQNNLINKSESKYFLKGYFYESKQFFK